MHLFLNGTYFSMGHHISKNMLDIPDCWDIDPLIYCGARRMPTMSPTLWNHLNGLSLDSMREAFNMAHVPDAGTHWGFAITL